MKIILRKDIEKLGKIGEIVNVKDGYARNYLLPKELAFVAKESAIRRIELAKKSSQSEADKVKTDAIALAEKINNLQITIQMKVGESNRLYGSVNQQLIATKINELGHNIDKNQILIEEPIKTLGQHEAKIKLFTDIIANIKVWVAPEETTDSQPETINPTNDNNVESSDTSSDNTTEENTSEETTSEEK